jgi:uncharacterized membrane protein
VRTGSDRAEEDLMSDLVVITFAKQEDGLAALKHIRDSEHAGQLALADTAVVEKDADGTIHVKNEVSSGTEAGAVGGGIVGLLLGFVFFPVLGIALGAAIGAAIGHSLGTGVDQDFVKDIQGELKPETSALFAVVKANPAALVAALRGFDGKVYQTTLGTELEESLNDALKAGN